MIYDKSLNHYELLMHLRVDLILDNLILEWNQLLRNTN